jgi:hypothetical protein
MNIIDLTENIAASQKKVKQLPANFRPANTSPQLSGPYPGRNATRGYLVGEDQQTDLGSVFEPNIERTSEYQRGYQSALAAKNPYQEGTTQWTRWLKGKIDKIGPRSKLRPEFGGLPQGSLDKPVSEIYNPLDQERQEQRAMDREREQFKRDELELELSGEEERVRAANEGTFYLRINGRIWSKSGQPVTFLNRERAVRAGQTIKDRDPDREVVVTRRLDDATPMAESRDPAYEDILTGLQKKLGDYLQDVATAVQRDPDLIDKLPQDAREIQAVKTIRTDDGHEIKIHGNEDDGFRISIQNQNINSSFRDLDEAVMACEMYCSHRRKKAMEADYIEEKKDLSTGKITKSKDQGVAEEKQKGVDGKACWKGYKRMGTKQKGGKTVDNCVKVGEGLRDNLAGLALGAGVALGSAGAADQVPTAKLEPIVATVVINGEIKKLDLTPKKFNDVREAEKWLDKFMTDRNIMDWQGKIERGTPGSGTYQRLTISGAGGLKETFSDDEYDQAMQDFLAGGGRVEQGTYKEPRLKTRIRRQGSRHIGLGREPQASRQAGRGANVGSKGKPVVAAEGLTWSQDFDPSIALWQRFQQTQP